MKNRDDERGNETQSSSSDSSGSNQTGEASPAGNQGNETKTYAEQSKQGKRKIICENLYLHIHFQFGSSDLIVVIFFRSQPLHYFCEGISPKKYLFNL